MSERQYGMQDVIDADMSRRIVELEAEVRRLKAALLDAPDSWAQERAELRAEVERLKTEVAYEQERNANNVRAYSEELEQGWLALKALAEAGNALRVADTPQIKWAAWMEAKRKAGV